MVLLRKVSLKLNKPENSKSTKKINNGRNNKESYGSLQKPQANTI
jgi:hypothetical protein